VQHCALCQDGFAVDLILTSVLLLVCLLLCCAFLQGISGQSSANISSSWGSLSSYDDESSSSTGGKVGSAGQPSWVSARGGSSSGSSNGVSPERDPPGSRLYTAAGAGTWRLKDNKLWLDEASQLPALMLVSAEGVAAAV